MKAIFLDIDGVLNNVKHCVEICDKLLGKEQYWALYRAISQMPFDYRCCELLQQLIEKTGAIVILSSTWRANKKNIDIVEKFAGIKIYDRTPILNTIRGEEIEHYLKQHQEISCYVIIDDDSDMLKTQKSHFCLVNREIGFSKKNYKKCLEIFNNGKQMDIV